MIHDFKTISKLVEKILREDRRSRDDDTYLLFKAWEGQGFHIPEEIREKIIAYAVSPESVRRVRQKIQEDGRYRGQNYAMRQMEKERVRGWSKENYLFGEQRH